LRPLHNFAPETAVRDVAIALRRNIDETAFDRILATLPQGAVLAAMNTGRIVSANQKNPDECRLEAHSGQIARVLNVRRATLTYRY
jgi:hypothetical protein